MRKDIQTNIYALESRKEKKKHIQTNNLSKTLNGQLYTDEDQARPWGGAGGAEVGSVLFGYSFNPMIPNHVRTD